MVKLLSCRRACVNRPGAICMAAAVLALLAAAAPASHAQDPGIGVDSHSVGNTILVTVTSSSSAEIHSIKLWIAEDNTFESFKADRGWIGTRQAPSLLTFAASEPLAAGGSAKFGVVTGSPAGSINWQALDSAGTEISRNTSVPGAPPPPPGQGGAGPDAPAAPGSPDTSDPPAPSDPPEPPGTAILESSAFRIVPTSPNVGSTIRIAGEGFGADKTVTLLLGSLNLSSIETGSSGRFVHTAVIPENTPVDRIEFTLTDDAGNTLQKSVRLGEARSRMTQSGSETLTVADVPASVASGDSITLSGTGKPGSFILVTLRHPSDYAIWIEQIRIDSNGQWSETFRLPVSANAGRYTAVVTDGAASLSQSWDVDDGLQINVLPSRLAYNPGDDLIFRGTATPGTDLKARLFNPQNILLYEDVFEIDRTGAVGFEVGTTTSYPKGTYVLFLSQGAFESVVPVGIGGRADHPFVIVTDQINYAQADTALITVRGQAESDATLSIVDTSKHNTHLTAPITLDADGLYIYSLDLANYTRGIYTASVSYGKNSDDHEFGVNLQYNTGAITVSTIKSTYKPTEPIIVLGETDKIKTLLDVVLTSPSGEEIESRTVFSDGQVRGKFSALFAAHSNYELGTWTVSARSGKNTAESGFELIVSRTEGIVVSTSEVATPGGTSVLITGEGALPNRQITVSITHSRGEVIEDGLLVRATGQGTFSMEWPNSVDLPPGTYTIRVTDLGGGDAETTYTVE